MDDQGENWEMIENQLSLTQRSMLIVGATVWLGFAVTSLAGDWPAWRGPAGGGLSEETGIPKIWGLEKNVRWKVKLPSGSNSSPVVFGKRVFVTAANSDGSSRFLLAFGRQDGSQLWSKTVNFDGREPTHSGNPYASASPVTDGEVVCASFGSAGLIGCTVEGELLWKKDLGSLQHVFGNASSPVLAGDLCILWCGPGRRQFVLAVNKRTGEEVWRFDVPGGKPDFDLPSDCVGSWATPLLAKIDHQQQLILNAPEQLIALDPQTGSKLWFADGLGKLAYSSPVVWQDTVVVMSGYHAPVLAAKATGHGDVTKTHVLWRRAERQPQRIGSPLVLNGRLYCINENGVAECFDVSSGKRLSQSSSRVCGQTWSSLVFADGHFYICSLQGTTTVLSADDDFEIVARNRLDDRIASSPAISNGQVFIRGYDYLYCIDRAN